MPSKKASTKKAVKKAATKKTAAKKAVQKAAPAKKAPAKKAAAKKAAPSTGATTVVAKCDLGFGNELYIRGEGGSLSWEKGAPLKNTGADEWVYTGKGALEFKLLANDLSWSAGENYHAAAGSRVVVVPEFED